LTTAAATSTRSLKPRPRHERRRRYPQAHSYFASKPIEECFLPGRLVWGWRATLCAAARANVRRLAGVAFTPVGVERLVMYLQGLFSFAMGARVNEKWILKSGKPQDDRRERPEGVTDREMSEFIMKVNYYRPGDARAALKRCGYLRARQPRAWNFDEDRWQGEANQIEITWRLVEALGVARAEVEAELEKEEAERQAAKKAQAQLEGQRLAAEQQAARDLRGVDHPLINVKGRLRKAGAGVLDLPVDSEGRRIPHTHAERERHFQIAFALKQDPEWKDRPAELLRAAALARWRDELPK
jgi:hypothetical protein